MSTGSPSVAPSSYVPLQPFTATSDCSLSRDLMATEGIVVDSPPADLANASSIAAFANPSSKDFEALVLTTIAGGPARQLAHVRRSQNETGWQLAPLAGAPVANEVCAGRAADKNIYAFYQDGKAFYSTKFDGTSWGAAETLASTVVSNLRVAYTPLTQSLVVYGTDAKGDLVITSKDSTGATVGPTTFTIKNLSLAGGDFALVMTSQTSFELMVNNGGSASWIQGDTVAGVQPPVDMRGFGIQVQQVVTGCWNPTPNANLVMFLLVDNDQQIHFTQGTSSDGKVVPMPYAKVSRAVGYQDSSGMLHLYSLDANDQLSVTHQTGWSSGSVNWSPVLPLAPGITALATDILQTDAPAIFALDGQSNLRLHRQNANTRHWRSGLVQQTSTEVYDAVRWRTEVLVSDANGAPAPGVPVTVKLADGDPTVDIVIAGTCYTIEPDKPCRLTTDQAGRLTFATTSTTGLATSSFVITPEGSATPHNIYPAQPLHTYLSGSGTLNPANPGGALPVLDGSGTTIAAAMIRDPTTGLSTGVALAPQAAKNPQLAQAAEQAIQQLAQVALKKMNGGQSPSTAGSGGSHAFVVTPLPADASGNTNSDSDDSNDITDSIKDFFGDIFEGIRNGVILILSPVIDAIHDVVSFTMSVVNGIAGTVKLVIDGLETAAHVIIGVFKSIGADIEKAIDWLKAIFDFAAIWRTKMAVQAAINAFGPWVQQMLAIDRSKMDNWFQAQEADVKNFFSGYAASGNATNFSGIGGWQDPSGGTTNTTPIPGTSVSPSSVSNNVHHNWAQDKMSTYSPGTTPVPPASGVGDQWTSLSNTVNGTSGTDFQAGLTKLQDSLKTLIDPSSMGGASINDFLQAIGCFIVAALKFADDLCDDVFDLASLVVNLMSESFSQPLNLGFINTLWAWIAKAAGYPQDTELNFVALASLLTAFPVTVIYKLAHDGKEPFPAESSPQGQSFRSFAIETTSPRWLNREVAGTIQILAFIPALLGIIAGAKKPWWFACVGIGMSIAIWVTWNGLPDLTTADWAGGITAVAANLLVLIPVGIIISTSSQSLAPAGAMEQIATAGCVVTSLAGIILLVAAGLRLKDAATKNEGWSQILVSIPSAMSFLQAPAIRNITYVQALSVLFAAVGYFIGGVLEMNADS
jgi:hypothetical protein